MGAVSVVSALLLDRRRQALVAAAAITGVLTGLAVAAFDQVTDRLLLGHLLRAPLAIQVLGPAVGLALAALSLRYLGRGASPATADEYVSDFHDPDRRLLLRQVPGRIVASIATLGFGGAMGFEGPAIYLGASIGSKVQHRFSRLFSRDDAKALLVAGAAGGVAAIFRAPATGVLFALEVPYQDDMARRGLIPGLVAGATGYLTFAALIGTGPLLAFSGHSSGRDVALRELMGALVLGVLAGLGARGFAFVMRRAKHLGTDWPVITRLALAGAGLATLAIVSQQLFGETLTLGPGYRTFEWMSDPSRGLWLLAALFAFRFLATSLTVGGGGAGGMFIPLVIQGSILGRFVAGAYDGLHLSPVNSPEAASSFFPILGIAAFLGAGYRTPLAAVMFVAESTGKAEFVVPALIAAAMSQLLMGNSSVSSVQQGQRAGHLERRIRLPLTTVLNTEVRTVPPDATLSEFVWMHAIGNRQRSVPVVDGVTYRGMCHLEDVTAIAREEWEERTVADVVRSDLPVGLTDWTLREALAAMEGADVDRLAVVDPQGTFIGEVTAAEIMKLSEILEDTGT